MLANTPMLLQEVLQRVQAADWLAFDLEADDKNSHTATICGFSVSDKTLTWKYYIPIAHHYDNADELYWRPILEEVVKHHLYVHNASYEVRMMRRFGIPIQSFDDTILMAHGVGTLANEQADLGLKPLVKKLFSYEMADFDSLFSRGATKSFPSLPVVVAEAYASDDAFYTAKLALYLEVRLGPKTGDKTDARKIYELEMNTLPMAMLMEDNGLPLNVEYMIKEGQRLQGIAEKVQLIWYMLVAERLHITPQLAKQQYPINGTGGKNPKLPKLLYDVLGLESLKATKADGRSTDGDALAPYRENDPIVNVLLAWREITSSSKSYLKIAAMIHPDGRLRASLVQIAATTGRFGSSNPNVQNWSNSQQWTIQLPQGKDPITIETKFRDSMQAPDGYYILEGDASQIEYRVITGFTQCKHLLKLYAERRDMHVETASFCFRIPLEQIDKDDRRRGKTINFALAFGMAVERFYREMKGEFPMAECAVIRDRYFEMLPEFVIFQNDIRKLTDRTHQISTYFGRMQNIPEYASKHSYDVSKARRAGVARRVQGTAADIHKITLVRNYRLLQSVEAWGRIEPILTLHDAIYWLVPNEIDPSVFGRAHRAKCELELPRFPKFLIDFKVGQTWGSLKDFDPGRDGEDAVITAVSVAESIEIRLPDDISVSDLKDFAGLLTGDGTLIVNLAFKGSVKQKVTSVPVSLLTSRVSGIKGASYDVSYAA